MQENRGIFSRPDKNGAYNYISLKENIDCYTTAPSNTNAATPTVIHAYGAGIDGVWYNSQEAALNRDAKFIFPARMDEPIDVFENVYREVFSNNTENVVLTGHSAGGPTALKALATMYKEGNVTGEPPLVVMLDGSFKACKLTPEEIKILADNKVPIVAYYQLDEQTSYYKMLGQNGVNIAMIKEYEDRTHDAPCINFFENKKGLYDFALGKGELMPGIAGYSVSVWANGEEQYTNGVNIKDISAINTIDKIYSMMGINTFQIKINHLQNLNYNKTHTLATNNNIFNLKIEQIISKIGNTSFITSNINYSTINNSSSTISKIADLSNEYFINTTDLLYNVSIELEEFKKISHVLSSVETQIGQSAVQLNYTNLTTPLDFSQLEEPFGSSEQL